MQAAAASRSGTGVGIREKRIEDDEEDEYDSGCTSAGHRVTESQETPAMSGRRQSTAEDCRGYKAERSHCSPGSPLPGPDLPLAIVA
jgi:hypothetical protein